jgi:hypothetical protein
MPQLPLQLVCSNKFGRYPKISREQVFNMFQSDDWMINYAGYEAIYTEILSGTGRGIFYSSRSGKGFFVIGQNIYSVVFQGSTPIVNYVDSLSTSEGDVFIDENLLSQIIFCDKQNLYVYDYSTSAFSMLPIDFSAGYVTFQDNRFIASCNALPQWRLSDFLLLSINTATVVNGGSGYHVGDVLSFTSGNNGTVTVATLSGTAVATVTVTNSGSGYDSAIVYAVTGGFGNGATFSITLNSGFTPSSQQVGSFQTKPDNVMACVRVPSKTGQILIMGKTVTEVWTDLGLQLFPYQRNSGYSIDYGCLNAATIATGDEFVAWLGSNEKSGPVIMVCSGGSAIQISDDGINYRLSQMVNPEDSFGFIFKQNGHTFYQLTFADPSDNVTFTYDFNVKKFYTLCDPDQNHHIARRVAFFNNDYYFVSCDDANLYQLSDVFNTANGREIPRIIITPTSALPDRSPFIVNRITFPIEQGTKEHTTLITTTYDYYLVDDNGNYLVNNDGDQLIDNDVIYSQTEQPSRIDFSTSSDGGITFGNPFGVELNSWGNRRNVLNLYNLGRYNELIFQFRFWGMGSFVLTNGVAEVSQQQ